MLLSLMVLCQAKRYVRIPTKLYAYTVGSGPSTTTEQFRSAATLRNVAAEGLTLRLAREGFNKLGCVQDEAMSGMAASSSASAPRNTSASRKRSASLSPPVEGGMPAFAGS